MSEKESQAIDIGHDFMHDPDDAPALTLRGSYNDACHCHPEYHEVEIEEPTVEALAKALAAAECGRWSPDLDDLRVTYRPAQHVLDAVRGLLDGARRERDEAVARAKVEAKRQQEARDRAAQAGLLRSELDRLRNDLTPEAIRSRENEIKRLLGKGPTS